MRLLALHILLVGLAVGAFAQPHALTSPGAWLLSGRDANGSMAYDAARPGPPGIAGVLTLRVAKPTEPFYLFQAVQDVAREVPSGSRVRLTFWARSATRNPIRAVVEKRGPPHTAVVDVNVTLTPEWKRYTAQGSTPGFGPNGLTVHLQVGHKEGVVEVAGVSAEDLGPDPAEAAARRAVEPGAIEERIRKHRMGNLRVVVTDSKGPVGGATVTVEQKRHAFLFGCNIFALQPGNTEPWQVEYQRRFTDLFNFATLPFYWGSYEPQDGQTQHARLDAMAAWCIEHGLATKGHPLVWHEVYPNWAPREVEAARTRLKARVADVLARHRAKVRYWDVLNEANNAAQYPRTGVGAWIGRDGPVPVVAETLAWAREGTRGSNSVLLYNDFNTSQANVDLLQGLKDRNSLPDAVGIQSHMHGEPWPIERVWMTAERFAAFGRPVHFTEVTAISGAIRPFDMASPPTDWVTTPEGERRQAEYLARFYTVLFSHPQLEAITYWDFADRSAWLNAPAGFLRKDMSPKPVYEALHSLIRDKWWTRASGKTARAGTLTVRAFHGDHVVTVRDDRGRTATLPVTLPRGAQSRVVRIRL